MKKIEGKFCASWWLVSVVNSVEITGRFVSALT